jgi:hypothetical protein
VRKRSSKSNSKPARRYPELLALTAVLSSVAWRMLRPRPRPRLLPVSGRTPSSTAPPNNRDFKPQTSLAGSGQESSDIYVPGLVALVIFMAVAAFMLHAALWGWFKSLHRPASVDTSTADKYQRQTTPRTGTAFPVLQVAPQREWKSFEEEQRRILRTYSWINQTAGAVRVPIEVAIQRILTAGIPQWGTNSSVSPLELQRRRADEQER